MLPRVLEPEVMDSVSEAENYNAMDHSQVNRVFVDDFLAALDQGLNPGFSFGKPGFVGRAAGRIPANQSLGRASISNGRWRIFDAGTGTALIPIELLQRGIAADITAADLAEQMLIVARRNLAAAGLESAVKLVRCDCKRLEEPDASYDAVMSNSIVHHIPEPLTVLGECWRLVRPRGLLFVRDLLRPDSEPQLERLVETYAGTANAHGQQMFRDSLHAALTVEEVGDLCTALGIPRSAVQASSDRHWTLTMIKV